MSIAFENDGRHSLAEFLRSRRARLNPAECGFAAGRRRTPGLRREEVAQLAGVSVTWYTWLEQGRMIRVSSNALERITQALRLDRAEREHLFMLAEGRPPTLAPAEVQRVSPALQRMLDGLTLSPSYIKTARWDIVAWNRAASLIFYDYSTLAPHERNSVRLVFTHPHWRKLMVDWEADAKKALAAFRASYGRKGRDAAFEELIAELDRISPEFHQWWPRHDVRSHGEGVKTINHPVAGRMTLEYTAFIVESEPELSVIVHTPANPEAAQQIASLMSERPSMS
jgi:transcriptional regulator with XRE-family HTH domain